MLIRIRSKINIINLKYMDKLGLQMQKTYINIQKIDNLF